MSGDVEFGIRSGVWSIRGNYKESRTYLGEGTVVPEIALVGEAIADISKLALLDVLFDGVEVLLLANL